MKAKLVLLAVGIIVGLGVYSFYKRTGPKQATLRTTNEKESAVDYKASFLIFTNGVRRDFSAERYHNLNDFVYIAPESPATIIVKKGGVTWGEFFATLPMKLTPDCLTTGTGQEFCNGEAGTLKFYLDGERAEDFLGREIKAGERALITFGGESEVEIQNQMSKVPTP